MDNDKYIIALRRIQEWCGAYPVDIFPAPDMEIVKVVLEEADINLGSVFAEFARMILPKIKEIVDKALNDE